MNFCKTLRSLKTSEKLLSQLWSTPKLHRTFLSEAYSCQEAWSKRMESPLLQKIKPIDFYLKMEQKFQANSKVHAVDIDVFANIIEDDSHADELADVLYKLRMTKETTYTLESTHSATVRYLLKIGKTDLLLDILSDRLNYGVFCDYYCYNMLMDYFIKKEEFGLAAKVASFMMLQEEFEHPISNALAIYSCHKYLENPESWQEVDPKSLIEEPKEEVKVRVKYIINPYFDDHFDLWKPSDLVGKTLFWIGMTMNDSLGRSCHLRGLVLFRKYAEAISLLKKWKDEGLKEIVYKDVLPLIKKDVPELFTDEANEEANELQKLLNDLENADLCNANLNESIQNLVQKAVDEHAQNDISKQTELFTKYEEIRMKVLREQKIELDRKKRLETVEEMKKELVERERLLTFFENEEKIELEIEQKLESERRLYGEETEKPTDLEDTYIPPQELRQRLNKE